MEQQSPVGRIWQWGEAEHGRLITAVVLAVLGTVCGMVPYFAAAKIITLLLAGEQALNAYTPWLLTALCGYLLRTVLYNSALSISHKATYNILKTIRQMLLAKLPKLPLGTVMDTSSGKLKQTIVDQVDGMETTLAHLFPEMTANIAAPVLTIVYLFVLDWRLALLSLVVFPVAFFFMMTVMGGYGKDYAGAVQATNEMSSTLIEYINGIEVIKAFNQGEKSYARLTEKARYNAQYYVNWMKKSQLGMAMAYGFFPAQMLTILPACGLAAVAARQSECRDLPDRHHSGTGHGGSHRGGVQLCGHAGPGGHHRGAGGRDPMRRGTGARQHAGDVCGPRHRPAECFLRLPRRQGDPARCQPDHPGRQDDCTGRPARPAPASLPSPNWRRASGM